MATTGSTTEAKLATAKAMLSAMGSVAAAVMVARTIGRDFLPHEVHDYFSSAVSSFFSRFSSEFTMIIDEFMGLENNQIYDAAELYLGNRVTNSAAHRLKVSQPETEEAIQFTVDRAEEITDVFDGVVFKWVLVCRQVETKNFYNPRDMNSTLRAEVRSFELKFHKKNKQKAIDDYIPYVLNQAKSMKQENKTIKLLTADVQNMYGNDIWTAVNLNHPATFDTLAMDSELKKMILDDLDRFVRRKEYYKRVGKAWKRGYLLYGPPGTGKSSLIAAMANHLKFDIYDLELTDLRYNSELRRLLVATANRSILVVEDIDCTIDLTNREAEATGAPPSMQSGFRQERQVTLSGLLNFIDGLWSSCGDERIIIFTTNHKDRLDPALLRPGRMDFHVHMSYCTPCGFKLLASNYLGIKNHLLFNEIEDIIKKVQVTPAEVAEQLLKHDEHESSLRGLIEFLKSKEIELREAEAKKLEAEQSKAKEERPENEVQGAPDSVQEQSTIVNEKLTTTVG
ncbi:hypothetical protein Ancab_003248 [Ancistrocladus abbreviatus]